MLPGWKRSDHTSRRKEPFTLETFKKHLRKTYTRITLFLYTLDDASDTEPERHCTSELECLERLRVCPREHGAVVLHAILPISIKLFQFKGSTTKLKTTKWFLFRLFPQRPPQFFLVFSKEVTSK